MDEDCWEVISDENCSEQEDDWEQLYNDKFNQFSRKFNNISELGTESVNASSTKAAQNQVTLGEYWNRKLLEEMSPEKRTLHKDRSDRATTEQVLDKRTLLVLRRLLQRGFFDSIEGCISTGKEANVYHAVTQDGKSVAVKVYKTSILTFRDRDRYVNGEFRYRHGYCKHNPRKMITVWAEKEMRNLARMYAVGLPVPEPKVVKQNVLVMDFVGGEGWPSPLLKDVELSEGLADTLYVEIVGHMRKLYRDCRLVHADLSEYNMMLDREKLFMFDVSQSVEHDHPRSLEFLRSDCSNITKFFRSKGVPVLSVRDLFRFVADPSIKTEAQAKEFLNKRTHEIIVDDALFMNAFIAQKLEQVLFFERDQQIEKAGGELPNPFQTMISRVKSSEEDNLEEEHQLRNSEPEQKLSECKESIQSKHSSKEEKIHKMSIHTRDRDESPSTKKERKRLVKEEKRENRLTKVPKHIKKRHNKANKLK